MQTAAALRQQIREGSLKACGHGDDCRCQERWAWEAAILEIYRAEREDEARHPYKWDARKPIMNDSHINGAAAPAKNPLGEAIARHASMLLRSNTLPNGMMQINAAQLYCDLELVQVRVEILFEALVDKGIIEPQEMIERLRVKLNAEADAMQEMLEAPQLEIVRGSIPRG